MKLPQKVRDYLCCLVNWFELRSKQMSLTIFLYEIYTLMQYLIIIDTILNLELL